MKTKPWKKCFRSRQRAVAFVNSVLAEKPWFAKSLKVKGKCVVARGVRMRK